MTGYAIFETAVVVLVGVLSAYQVMRVLMPRMAQKLGAILSTRLTGSQGGGHSLTRELPATGSGCGLGCGSGCNGCGAATGNHQSLAGRQVPPR